MQLLSSKKFSPSVIQNNFSNELRFMLRRPNIKHNECQHNVTSKETSPMFTKNVNIGHFIDILEEKECK